MDDDGYFPESVAATYDSSEDMFDAAADWARDQGLHKLCLEVFAHNAAAIAAYRKAGYAQEGRRVAQYRRASGELWDTIVMGLLL